MTRFSALPGVFSIYSGKSGKLYARVLFDDNLTPVEYYRPGETIEEVIASFSMDFPFVEFIRLQEFESELDHIKLFNCRSDAPSWELPTERLTDDQILGILNDSDRVLDSFDFDKIKENADAVLSSPVVENDPWLTN